jgi:PAS domain S-box-containing protein
MEVELNKTKRMNQVILDSSSEVIVQLSADLKVLEFNHEAEKFFGIKHREIINQNFIQTFIPEPAKKKTEKELGKLQNNGPGNRFKMQVIAAGGEIETVEWVINGMLNESGIPVEMMIIKK